MGQMLELSAAEMESLLDEQVYGRLGCYDDGEVYVLPLIYVREGQVREGQVREGQVREGQSLYIMTTEGRKIQAMRKNPAVCFEVDEQERSTGNWRSVIVQGQYEELGAEDTTRALGLLSARFGKRRPSTEPAPPAARPTLAFRIRILSATGRAVRRA